MTHHETSKDHRTTSGRLLYTVREAGESLGLSPFQTRELVKAGALSGVKQANGRIYITPAALAAYVATLPAAGVK